MHFYTAFGGCLRSEIAIPDLPRSRSRTADWSVHLAKGPPSEAPLELLGEHERSQGGYELYRTSSGLRLVWLQNYVFDVDGNGHDIVWYPAEGTTEEFFRALLLGPVLALMHHLAGAFCLHGSAVAVGGQGIAFLAAKYHGKSTLGLAMTLGGARHLSDDAVVVDMEPSARVRPGVHSVRLWNDSADQLSAAELDCSVLDGVKKTLTDLPRRLVQRTAVPLSAIYVLRPVVPSEEAPAAQREVLPPSLAAVALSHHAKLPHPLIGDVGSVPQFLRAVTVARHVPVYSLFVMRDFARLPEVVETILGWHRAPRRRGSRVLATTSPQD